MEIGEKASSRTDSNATPNMIAHILLRSRSPNVKALERISRTSTPRR